MKALLTDKVFCQNMWHIQGVLNRREIQLTRPALPYDYTAFQTVLYLNKKYLSNVKIPRIQSIQ